MIWLVSGIVILIACGLAAFCLGGRHPKAAVGLALAGQAAALAFGLAPVLRVLTGGTAEVYRQAWQVPGGSLALRLDALSAFFLLLILIITPLAGLFGAGYLSAKTHPRRAAASWFFYNLLQASMCLVVLADNAVLFLAAWEAMAVSSYFLVVYEHERPEARKAGWIYLAATHCGTACLLALFALLSTFSLGSMDFAAFRAATPPASLAGPCFLLALVGFGVKAGFVPFYAWLPEAHPAAPSHVSAVMSGLMIKTGIYGILRCLAFLGLIQVWWGWLVLLLGAVGGILGVLQALAQHDLKRLLAYSSVENIGIIAMGMGLGLLGRAWGFPLLEVLGFAGALLHVANHAIFKSLLFLGAGAVLRATGTREMDHLGGLLKRMPVTGTAFLVGAMAISGLPPFNGFVSEFLILFGGLKSLAGLPAAAPLAGSVLIAALALISGLAAACFAKAFTCVFLGRPRGLEASQAQEGNWPLLFPMGALALACLGIGLAGPWAAASLAACVESFCLLPPGACAAALGTVFHPLAMAALLAGLGLALAGALALLRRLILARRVKALGMTWDCGYAVPADRAQYTSSSFAQPLLAVFSPWFRQRRAGRRAGGYFPTESDFKTRPEELLGKEIYQRLYHLVQRAALRGRVLQQGSLHLYVLYIALALAALLIWKLS